MKNSICKLDNRVQFLRADKEMDEVGGVCMRYVPAFSAWARVQPLPTKSGETWQGGVLEYFSEYKVWVRVGMPIAAGMHVIWKGHRFEMRNSPLFTEDKKFQIFVIRQIESEGP